MSAPLPLFLGTFLVDLVVAAILGVLWARERAPQTRWWAAAILVAGLRHVVASVDSLAAGAPAVHWALDPLIDLLMVSTPLLLLQGAHRAWGRSLHRAWPILGAVAVVWGFGAQRLASDVLLWRAPLYLYSAVCLVVAGWRLVKLVPRRFGAQLAGIALVVWGIHRGDYPWLRPMPEIAPWGFALAQLLEIAVGIGLVTLTFERVWEQARDRERDWRSLFDDASEGVFRASVEGRLLAVNPALVSMLGYPDEQALLRCDPGRDLVEDPETWRALCAGGREGTEAEDLALIRSDGSRLLADVRARVVEDRHAGRRVDGFVRDVTARRSLEAKLAASERLEALGRVAGGVAHDFNNLLTVMIAGMDVCEASEGDAREGLEEARMAAEQAARLTRELLTFGRRRPSAAVDLELGEASRAPLGMLRRLVGPEVDLAVEVPEAPVWIRIDPTGIERVLVNLVVNAAEAMDGPGRIRVRVAAEGDDALLTVEDDGPGIPPEVAVRVFEPFFTTKTDRGTGLGLSTVYGIVTQAGGRIDVESAPGTGTTFLVRLPRTREVGAPARVAQG